MEDFSRSVWVILENLEDAIFVIDKEYKIIWANKCFINLFHKKNTQEVEHCQCFTLYDNNKSVCESCLAEKTFKENIIAQHIINRRERAGEKIVLKETYFPLTDESNNVSLVLVYAKDCTHEAKLEEQLRSSDRLIEIGKLASGIAHEVRNPLGNITAAAQFIYNKTDTNNEIKKYLKIILRNSERMNKVIKELLNLAKPHQLTFSIGYVGKVVDNVCGLVKARLSKQKIRLIKKFSKYQSKILLDEKLLEGVFLNLILNSIEAMPKGGKLTITVFAGHVNNDDVIEISISDTGVGIPEENLRKIFEPFFTSKKDGSGFGLSFVRQIVDMHKGKIDIKSKPDYGTEVKVFFPVYKEGI